MFKVINKYFENIHDKFSEYFLGRGLIRVIEGVFLAILIASFTVISSFVWAEVKKDTKEISSIEEVNIGVSETYINSKLGEPKYKSYYRKERIKDCYYVLNGVVIRVFYQDESVKAFFVTLTKINWVGKIPINIYGSIVGEKTLGEFSYYDINYIPDYTASVFQNGTGYAYYLEKYWFSSTGNYRVFIFANLPYGLLEGDFSNQESYFDNEIQEMIGNDNKSNNIEEFGPIPNRRNAYPSTYGIIDPALGKIEDILQILLDWESIDYSSLSLDVYKNSSEPIEQIEEGETNQLETIIERYNFRQK